MYLVCLNVSIHFMRKKNPPPTHHGMLSTFHEIEIRILIEDVRHFCILTDMENEQ